MKNTKLIYFWFTKLYRKLLCRCSYSVFLKALVDALCGFFLRFDEEIIYTDKDEYQLAIGYHNDIFKNGLKATITLDHAVMPMSVEERPKPSGDNRERSASDDDTSLKNNDTKVSSSFDEEESIDQNGVTEQYQAEANGKVR